MPQRSKFKAELQASSDDTKNNMITKEDLDKLEVKIGKIESAEKVENADKLLKLIVDFGTEKRQIITAMASFFPNPGSLVGKQVPVFVNLEPKVFRGHESQGMIMAIDTENGPVFLLPESEVANGSRVI